MRSLAAVVWWWSTTTVAAWTMLVPPSDPHRLGALLDGTAQASASAPVASPLGGLSYVWNASEASALTFAVDDRACAQSDPSFVSFVDRLPGPSPSCAQLRAWVGRALGVWREGLVRVREPVDVTDECRAAHGTVTTQTCSAEAGGPAHVFVTLEAADGGHAVKHPSSAPPPLRPQRDHEQVLSRTLRAQRSTHRRASDDVNVVITRGNSNVLATAWVYAAPTTEWAVVSGRRPRLSNGTPQTVLATTGCIVALSTREHAWCGGMGASELDVDAAACAALEETQTTGCLPPMSVLVHEMGHCLSTDHPEASNNVAITPEDGPLDWWHVDPHPERVDASMEAFLDTARPPWPSVDDLEAVAVVYDTGVRPTQVVCANHTYDDHSADDDDDDDDDDGYDDDDDMVTDATLSWVFWSSLVFLCVLPLGLYWYVPVTDYSIYPVSNDGRSQLVEEDAGGK